MTNEEIAAKQEFGAMTPDQAKGAIAQMKASTEFWAKRENPSNPGFALANAAWKEAHRAAYPEPKKETK